MKVVVITPVGPGHEPILNRAKSSVEAAIRYGSPPSLTNVKHTVIGDGSGVFGRSRARNLGIDRNPDADWFFFLDADDIMRPDALCQCDFNAAATFGAVSLNGRITPENVWPCTWQEIVKHGASGTLSMGFFCRADVARQIRFREDLDAGEDFEFYMRLPSFTKREEPLVDIGRDVPSAGGPRGYARLDWVGVCNRCVYEAVARDPKKFDVRRDAVLAPAGSADQDADALQGTLPF